MRRATRITAILLGAGVTIAGACSQPEKPTSDDLPSNSFFIPPPQPPEGGASQRPKMNTEGTLLVDPGATDLTPVNQAIVTLYPTKDNKAAGVVRFTATNDGVRVKAELSGLTFLSKYALHVHVVGDCSTPDGSSAGPPFNFDGSSLSPADYRYGGLGELEADVDGKAKGDGRAVGVAIQGPFTIVGRSLAVHATSTDPSKPPGAGGQMLACGVIGIFADAAPTR
jgi:Cu-Zn family superoxide dismutase